MKKSSKIVVFLLALVMVVLTFALTACSSQKFQVKYAYGYQAFGEGYISIARVEVDKEGNLISARLDESCFPNAVELSEEDTKNLASTDYGTFITGLGTGSTSEVQVYSKVKVGDIVFTLDSTTKAYKVDGKTLAEYFKDNADARKAYAVAVSNNEIYVYIGGVETAGIITKADLLKSQNGYWTINYGKGWGTNTFAICNYVMENGFGATSFTKENEFVAGNNYIDNNGVDTGASCTDFREYFALLKEAYEAK